MDFLTASNLGLKYTEKVSINNAVRYRIVAVTVTTLI